jgi:GNAT superfamily N-acetyltransferase
VSIIHLRKQLSQPPALVEVPTISVRTFAGQVDAPAWLALRARAIAHLRPQPRHWLHADYEAEMFGKPWWQAARNWLAFAEDAPEQPLGAVTLAIRAGKDTQVPIVHWLLVDPKWRRHGVGRVLMSELERAAWDDGHREVELETHSGWTAAVAFYGSIGYAPVRAPSAR